MPVKYAIVDMTNEDVGRFWSHVARAGDDECWLWTAGLDDSGYGSFQVAGQRRIASRISWQITNGHTPKAHVCHSCDEPRCVNPKHLWLGSDHDNHVDMALKGRGRNQHITHCKNGHEFTPENTYRWGVASRRCRACNRINSAKSARRRRAGK